MSGSEAVPGGQLHPLPLPPGRPGAAGAVLREPVSRLSGLPHPDAVPHLDHAAGHPQRRPSALRQRQGEEGPGHGVTFCGRLSSGLCVQSGGFVDCTWFS